jgi:two-component system CheB/CheR fusion protein
MNADRTEPLRGLAAYLEQRRELVTLRWVDAVRAELSLRQSGQLNTEQRVGRVPEIYVKVCAARKTSRQGEMPVALERNVPPAWSFPQDYRLDELFREMDFLRRVIGRGNALPGRLRPASDCIWSTR